MADVQIENGYTMIANEIFEAMAKVKLSPTQYRILFVVWRYTYGFKRHEHELSLSFISAATGCDKRQIQRELKSLEGKKIIIQKIKSGSYRIISFNKNYDVWGIGETTIGETTIGETTIGETVNTTIGETVNTTIGETVNQERKIKESIKENSVTVIFNHYISKNIINHKKITSSMRTSIKTRLKDHTVEDLIKAIDNYSIVYKSEEHWFTHKYPLADFMKDRGLSKFLDEADPLNNFANKKKNQNINQIPEIDNEKILKGLRNRKKDLEMELDCGIESFKHYGGDGLFYDYQKELGEINERLRVIEEAD